VYAIDTAGHINYVNVAVVIRSERSREWLIGKHFSVLIRPEDRERVQKNFEGRLHGQRIPNYEILYNTPSGKEPWVEIITKALYDNERVVGVVVLTHDITEHKRIEKALRESEERFRSLFEHHNAVLFLFDPVSGAIVDVNDSAARFYGYTPAGMREMSINEINRLGPD
jgi:PAS domain S-box-containing protein